MPPRKRWHSFYFMKEDKICSFFGHRDIVFTEALRFALDLEIKKIIEQGCHTFYFGGYGDFDALCHQIVTKIKTENPHLKIQRIYCVAQEHYLQKKVRFFQRENYEDIIYLPTSFQGWYKSIYFRNCAMINQSDFIIFYAKEKENSGAYKAYKYAKKHRKNISNLWELCNS